MEWFSPVSEKWMDIRDTSFEDVTGIPSIYMARLPEDKLLLVAKGYIIITTKQKVMDKHIRLQEHQGYNVMRVSLDDMYKLRMCDKAGGKTYNDFITFLI